jgi:hypothetical protein
MSGLVAAVSTSICRPMVRTAACTSRVKTSASGLVELTSTAMRSAPGSSSCRTASRFAVNSVFMLLMPVTLPPGRLRLATRPIWTGQVRPVKTIGIVDVAALAATAAGVLDAATMTATRRRTRSAASCRSRANSP